MDTEYTKGFRAGMAWREAEIIKLLEAFINDCTQEKLCRNCIGVNWAIAEIKGEK